MGDHGTPFQGCNDGTLRMPTMRLQDAQVNALREALTGSGFTPGTDPFREFFTGRNPA